MDDLQKLMDVCIAVSCEKNLGKLLRKILDTAMDLSRSDAGTLYMVENNQLVFKVTRNREIEELNGSSSSMPPIPLNSRNHICSLALLEEKTITVSDAYECKEYNLSGAREYDRRTGYHTQSVLVVPLLTKSGDKVGVLQLINCTEERTGFVCPYSQKEISITEALAAQISVVLQNARYEEAMQNLRLSLEKQIPGADIPEEIRSGLSAFMAENFYGSLSEQELARAVEDISSKMPDGQHSAALKRKRERQKKDALPLLSSSSDSENAEILTQYTDKLKQPKALDVLREYVWKSDVSVAELGRRSCIHKGTVSGIISGKRSITKENLVPICIGLRLNLEQTEELLSLSGYAFTGAERRDLVLQYFITYNETALKPYDAARINDVLYAMGLPMIGAALREE